MFLTYPDLEYTGRLGNQLWEIAGTLGLARSLGLQPLFPPSWTYRPFFSVPDAMFGEAPEAPTAVSRATGLAPVVRHYLQAYYLWQEFEEEVRAIFTPSPRAVEVLDQYKEFAALSHPIVSVHVRRGDNVVDPGVKEKWRFMPLRSIAYYMEQMEHQRKTGSHMLNIAMFSDDIPWCRDKLPYADYYHEGVPRPKDGTPEYWSAVPLDWIDLFLMARCQRHIISNSTYAWWGAFLSEDEHPIYPSNWFGPALDQVDTSLMFPPGWIEVHDSCF